MTPKLHMTKSAAVLGPTGFTETWTLRDDQYTELAEGLTLSEARSLKRRVEVYAKRAVDCVKEQVNEAVQNG